MYKCFATIPQDVRQKAFDLFRENALFVNRPTSSEVVAVPGKEDLEDCCPWGAVNLVLLSRHSGADAHSFYKVALPQDGREEAKILRSLGLSTDTRSVNAFINRNDGLGFESWQELAEAMGVESGKQE